MVAATLNLTDERRWGELLLAAQDMTLTIKLIERIPGDRSNRDRFLDAIGVIAAYGRPFKKGRDGKPGVGVDFLHVLDSAGQELHRKAIDLRDSDYVHSDFYEGRIHVKFEGAVLYVE